MAYTKSSRLALPKTLETHVPPPPFIYIIKYFVPPLCGYAHNAEGGIGRTELSICLQSVKHTVLVSLPVAQRQSLLLN